MRTNLIRGVDRVRLVVAIGISLASIGPLAAQGLPTLPDAVASGGADVWSGGELGNTLAAPADEYLTPIPSPELGTFGSAYNGEPCNTCNGEDGAFAARYYNRCGCETPMFPWFTGPGHCDTWCVGPHWNVEVDGMFVHRDDAEWEEVTGATAVDEFEFGPGVRIFATGYNYTNYGLQIGYEGVNDFNSLATTATDEITYQSTLNSLEINVLRRTAIPLKVFAGFRFIEIDEDLVAVTLANGDGQHTLVENRLMGFQIGGLRDAWQLNRWITIEPFGNAGVYFNDFKREYIDIVSGAFTYDTNEFSEIAYLGEAGVTSVLRINQCLALRGGYQVMAFNGVGTAIDASLNPGLDTDTIIYHGARFGVEYQR